ncbi:retrovirus-related Pol polyprotein from transposon RE1 [Trichonephila clavipes]|nr:retrovirus-related Pol polyprotein from transposon RE1 [Trichonephila clavipes]
MRAKMGIMMGYAQRTKGYRIWLIDENKLVETINVRFDESRRGINFRQKVNSNLGYNLNLPDYYDDEDDSDRVKDSLTSRLVSKTSTETPSTSEKPDVSSDNHSLIPCTEVKWIRNIGRKVTGSNVYYSIEGEATRLKSFNEIERYCKRHNIEYDPSLFNFRKDNAESQGFSDLSEQQEALMVEVTIPNCHKQAIRSRDASKWRDAMDKEINVMKERKVWDLVDHPDNIKILENRWVYTIKYDENNKIVRYKARLVARGNTQLRSESFDEVFQEYKLELSKVKSLKLRCYSDSDFATNRDDRVSMGGFITFIDETPISWRTFKQKSVSLSTMEAEYVSLTEAAKEFIWLKNLERGRIIGMMEAGWFARRVARQLGSSDCVVRKCWDQGIREMSFTRRPGSGRLRQTSHREDRHTVRNARVQATASSAAIQAQRHIAPTAGVTVWGAIAYNIRSPLVLIRGTVTAQR